MVTRGYQMEREDDDAVFTDGRWWWCYNAAAPAAPLRPTLRYRCTRRAPPRCRCALLRVQSIWSWNRWKMIDAASALPARVAGDGTQRLWTT
jgi:hypothetical protein